MKTLAAQLTNPREELTRRLKTWEDWLSKNPEWQAVPKDILTSDADPLRDIKRFVHCLTSGVYPPADCLLSIAQSFASYLDGDAPKLELAFRLRAIQRSGTPVAREQAQRLKRNVLWHMAELRVCDGLTIENAAEIACQALGVDKPESASYERYYKADDIGSKYEKEWQTLIAYSGEK